MDTLKLKPLLADLSSCRDEAARSAAARRLRAHVESEARSMFGQRLTDYMADLNKLILEHVKSSTTNDKLAGIAAIDELIDVESDENATKINRFAVYLRMCLPHTEAVVMDKAASALGHLARAGGTLALDFVEFEVRRALGWLREVPAHEPRRQASVLMCRELALNAPTLFYVSVEPFFKHIWPALWDPKVEIRNIATGALCACLELTARRELSARSEWYSYLFEQSKEGCRSNSADRIHGSLLAIGELFRNAEEFMSGHIDETFELVLRYKDNRTPIVRRTVIELLPRLGRMRQSLDSKGDRHFSNSVDHLIRVLRQGTDRPVAFVALGKLALVEPRHVKPHLKAITQQIRDSTNPRSSRKAFCEEAVDCAGMIARAVGPDAVVHMSDVFDCLFNAGLSRTLIASLVQIVDVLPVFEERVHSTLLNAISMTLLGQPFAANGEGSQSSRGIEFSVPTGSDPSTNIILALNTLSTFDFGPQAVMHFMQNSVLELLEDESENLRREAVTACARMLERTIDSISPRSFYTRQIADAIAQMLQVGIADESANIRLAVLDSLHGSFDVYLADRENIRSLYLAINDEDMRIRERAVVLIGRLTDLNPAYVLPCLRTTLIQLLAEMDAGDDGRTEGGSARLLGIVIRSAPRLARPYVSPVLEALIRRLEHPGGCSSAVAASGLGAIGELSGVGSVLVKEKAEKLFRLAIDGLQDQSSTLRRQIALRTLGQLVESTGFVIKPYFDHPHLLSTLLNALRTEPAWDVRREVIKLIGILGAVDPHRHAVVAATQEAQTKEDANEGSSSSSSSSKSRAANSSSALGPSSPDYFPTIAIAGLMKILRDPSLSQYSNMVVQAVMQIFKNMGLKCVPFLKDIVPPILNVMLTCESGLRDFLFQQLGELVRIVKQHIRPYMSNIFELILQYWDDSDLRVQILGLVEKLAVALGDEFKPYLSTLIPHMLSVLRSDRSEERGSSRQVLHAFEVFGANLDEHLHLVIPDLVALFNLSDTKVEFRRAALRTVGYLCRVANISDFTSRIVHPLVRVLDSTDSAAEETDFVERRKELGELRDDAMNTLCNLVYQVGETYAIFVKTLEKVILRQGRNGRPITNSRYEQLVACLSRHEPFPPELDDTQKEGAVGHSAADNTLEPGGPRKMQLDQENLRKAWETSQRSIKDDWAEWMRQFSVELLRESSSPALRFCSSLAQVYQPLARELFNAAFVSCYTELERNYKKELVQSLERAFGSSSITPDILQLLLNLAEFMEHDEKPLPIDIRTLGALAKQCHAYAKALHYKELEFQSKPADTIEELIEINNRLGQQEAAAGILKYAQQEYGVELQESWYEKLNDFEKALQAYDRRRIAEPENLEAQLGTMRCLNALGNYDRVSQLSIGLWKNDAEELEPARKAVAPLAAYAAWGLGSWPELEKYVGSMRSTAVDTNLFTAVLAIWKSDYVNAQAHIDTCRDLLDKQVTALVGESYTRAYRSIISVQELAELEEIIDYRQCEDPERQHVIKQMWKDRLFGARRHVATWMRMLNIRRMIIPFNEDPETYVKFVSLCTKSNEMALAAKTLASMLNVSQDAIGTVDISAPGIQPIVAFSYLRYLWLQGHDSALQQLNELAISVSSPSSHRCHPRLIAKIYHELGSWQQKEAFQNDADEGSFITVLGSYQRAAEIDPSWYKAWRSWALMHYEIVNHYERLESSSIQPDELGGSPAKTDAETEDKVLGADCKALLAACSEEAACTPAALEELVRAAVSRPGAQEMLSKHGGYGVATDPDKLKQFGEDLQALWRTEQPRADGESGSAATIEPQPEPQPEPEPEPEREPQGLSSSDRRQQTRRAHVHAHVVPAVKGFFQSIALSSRTQTGSILQDLLRLLSLWFKYGAYREVDAVMVDGINAVSIDNWLQVVPQLIARIHKSSVRDRMHDLLCRIAQNHPQALIFPLAVTTTMSSGQDVKVRKENAQRIMDHMREKFSPLVEQALIVAKELVRVAVLWHERWQAGLEEASRLYFAEKNIEGMLAVLTPLHKMMEKGAETANERAFIQSFGRELDEALKWCNSYRRTERESDLNQAWDLYCQVFRKINKQLPTSTTLELQAVSPRLHRAGSMELAVPGTYRAGISPVTIEAFNPVLTVIPSKQRPRKLTIKGSDGRDWEFLLKGHEDIRQDERVMQLLGLINGLLERDHETSDRDLSIRRYGVVPLNLNSGLIGWVPNHEALHVLIRDYRETHKIIINIEHRLMLQMAPDYDQLTLLQKVEVFNDAMSKTNGEDLKRVMWLKSKNAEAWLDRRTNFTRSLATMSMVGYILGLGDRHPQNLLLDSVSGKVLHVDFGDCFEVAIHRDKFPETIPFRLTRMLRKAMDVSGIESNFRATCESVLRVLRQNQTNVMAMLEAFVYDPLVNWRLNALQDQGKRRRQRNQKKLANSMQGSAGAIIASLAESAATNAGVLSRRPSAGAYTYESSHAASLRSSKGAAAGGGAAGNQDSLRSLNSRAVDVINRVSSKLRGKDFPGCGELEVPEQVQRLIEDATSVEHLCQCYLGWCPFW
jgi:FKBP12-rapamycin complex-associated protein